MPKQTRRSVARVRFVLKDKAEKETLIFLTIRINKRRVKWSTSEHVNPKNWNVKLSRAVVRAGSAQLRQLNARLDQYAVHALAIHSEGEHRRPEDFKTELDYRTGKAERPDAGASKVDTSDFIRFAESVRDLRKDSTDIAKETWRNIDMNTKYLREFADYKHGGRVAFQDVDDLFVGDFKKFLFRIKGHKPQTVFKAMAIFRSMASRAADRGLMVYDRRLKQASRQTFRNRPHPILNRAELQKVIGLDLSDNERLDKVRDLFLIGVATAQRWSDFSTLTPSNFHAMRGGRYRYYLPSQRKTKSVAGGPVMGWAVPVLEKYGYIGAGPFRPIKISRQKFNDYIKEVMQQAIPDATFRIYDDGEKIDHVGRDVAKWSEIASHTARRTAVSLLRSMKAPDDQIQKMTGHKTLAELDGYDQRDAESMAAELGGELDKAWLRVV